MRVLVLMSLVLFVPSLAQAQAQKLDRGARSPANRVDDAARAYEQLEFERCLELLTQVPGQAAQAARPASERALFARAALYRGLCHFNLAQSSLARTDFQEALQLVPTLTLPNDVSPKVTELFEQVRTDVAAAAARTDAPAATAQAETPPTLVPSSDSSSPATNAPFVTTERARGPSRVGPAILGGVSVAAAIAAGVFGLQAKSEESQANEAHFTSDAKGFADSAHSAAKLSNVSWISAGVALAVAAGWFGYSELTTPSASGERVQAP